MFKRRWKIYKEGSNIPDSQASSHLFQCADTHLGDALLKTDPDIVNKTIAQVLTAMEKLAVIPVPTGFLRAELLNMKQERNETFRKFSSKVKEKAETCNYSVTVTCRCEEVIDVNFTEEI